MEKVSIEQSLKKIDSMVERIVEQFHPYKVILFGSYARGNAGPDSDVDLMVVMDIQGSRRKQAVQIDLALADRDMPLDLVVVTPQELERYCNIVGHLVYPVVREGKVLYAA